MKTNCTHINARTGCPDVAMWLALIPIQLGFWGCRVFRGLGLGEMKKNSIAKISRRGAGSGQAQAFAVNMHLSSIYLPAYLHMRLHHTPTCVLLLWMTCIFDIHKWKNAKFEF